MLNEAYLGCDAELSRTSGFPLTSDFFKDAAIRAALDGLGVTEIHKIVPNLNPCADTLSLARRGDTIKVPDFWNILLFEFNADQAQMDIPNLSVFLTMYYQHAIKVAQPNFLLHLQGEHPKRTVTTWIPNDPEITSSGWKTASIGRWDPTIGSYGTDVNIAWDRTKGDSETIIGVIDDGICGKSPSSDEGHPDFGNQGDVVSGGWNYDAIKPARPHTYAAGHGTRAASIIGALSNNELCIPGIVGGSGQGDNAKLIALKVGDIVSTGSASAISAAIVEASIKDATSPAPGKWGCDMLSISLEGAVNNELLRSAMAFAYANDLLVGVAMGNYSRSHDFLRPTYPAGVDEDWVLAVGGYTQTRKHTMSDYGWSLDVLAPWYNYALDATFDAATGQPIDYFCDTADPNSGKYAGTSSACPHAVGIAALLHAYWKQSQGSGRIVPPYLAPEDISSLLAEGATNLATPSNGVQYLPLSKDTYIGFGLVNAENTLALIDNPYTLEHIDVSVFDLSPTPIATGISAFAFPGDRLGHRDTLYEYRQYHIQLTNLSYGNGKTYNGIRRVWGRGARTGGYPDIRQVYDANNVLRPLPIYRNATWCRVTGFREASFDVETYLYEVSKVGSGVWGWLDNNTPYDLTFAISVLADGTSTGINATDDPELIVSNAWPNPIRSNASGYVRFSFPANTTEITLQLFDVLGRDISANRVDNISTGSCLIPTQGLRDGVYFVRFSNRTTSVIKPFTVLR